MRTISKSVLQLTGQVIQEDDKEEFFDLLNQARHRIHWELESEAYGWHGTRLKNVLRYILEQKEWAVYRICAETGKARCVSTRWWYYKKYEDALRAFNSWCEFYRTDPAKAKHIKPVFDTE